MTADSQKCKHLHTVTYKLKDGSVKVVRYHRLTRRRIHAEPGTRAFRAEFAWAGKTEENRGRKHIRGKEGAASKTGFVYFVEAVGLGLVKIGWAKDVRRRLATMQSGSPVDLRLLASLPGVPIHEARMHGQFAHLRHQREWFRLEGDIIAFLGSL